MSDTPYPAARYAWYVVFVLLLAYILAFVDREIIAQLVGGIKQDFSASDKDISLLLGGAFALFYTGFAMPIAWLADRGSRKWLLTFGIFVWSCATMLCGLADTYWYLFLARMFVGVGEATLNPCALSMIKDYFPPERIGRAIGLYTAGVSSGSGLAFIIGAAVYPGLVIAGPQSLPLLGVLQPWQQMFVYVGLPGLIITLLMLTVREPARRLNPALSDIANRPASFRDTLLFVGRRWRAYAVLYVSLSAMAIMAYGISLWIPEFLKRSYALTDVSVAPFLRARGLIAITVGLLGVLLGGYLCDRFRKAYDDAYVRVCILGYVFMAVGYSTFTLMPTPALAIAILIPATFGAAIPTAAGAASIIAIAPPNMRAKIVAIYYFTLNFIGLFAGPWLVATVTQDFFHDEKQLRYSLAIVAAGVTILGIVGLFFCLKPYRAATREAAQWAL